LADDAWLVDSLIWILSCVKVDHLVRGLFLAMNAASNSFVVKICQQNMGVLDLRVRRSNFKGLQVSSCFRVVESNVNAA
jgi:hypothetical protein